HKVNIDISCDINSEKINSDVIVLVYGMNQSITNVKVTYKLDSQAIDSLVNQKIIGIMLSNDAVITGIPNLIVNCLEAKAEHSLKIGALDMEELFYLLCKGFNEKESKNILIQTEINKIINNLNEQEKQICLETIKRKLM
ncbi:MAG: SufD family Fe-S cluster assembly protein, partial [Ureaplasma sp.]|nr:SufD family Fe-S cluster assembly protein [Ureaplasma sp.]